MGSLKLQNKIFLCFFVIVFAFVFLDPFANFPLRQHCPPGGFLRMEILGHMLDSELFFLSHQLKIKTVNCGLYDKWF